MKSHKRTRAQSVLEYAVIISVAVAALMAMHIYMKRAGEGKLRDSADQIGQQFDIEKIGNIHTASSRSGTTVQETGLVTPGVTVSRIDGNETSRSVSNETINK